MIPNEDSMRTQIQGAIDDFLAQSGFREPLKVSQAPYYPYRSTIAESYPNSEQPGCYIWVDGSGKIHDVGKASRAIGPRIGCHLGKWPRKGEPCEFPNAERFIQDHKPDVMVWTIPVPADKWWICLSLEGFLTERLLPEIRRV
ncbi:MAG TPA: hypothetical protein VHC22_03100 [Pirellulales bacterium]|nr:hypothetical protein [Pirellulales bacterium]